MSDIDDFEPNLDDGIDDLDTPTDEPDDNDVGKPSNDPSQDDDDLDFSFDEPPQADDDEIAKLRAENLALKQEKAKWEQSYHDDTPKLRAMPTEADHDWDYESYQADMQAWLNERDEYHAMMAKQENRYAHINQNYAQSRERIKAKVADYDEVEQLVASNLSDEKQALLKMAVGDVGRVVYALGKSQGKLLELSKLDEVAFIRELVLMEQKLQNRPKSNKPAPKDHELTGVAGGGDERLAKLEAEASRTGDRTKVQAYKRQLKAKQQS